MSVADVIEDDINTAQFSSVFHVTLQIRCQKSELFEIIVSSGVIGNCDIASEDGSEISSTILYHKNEDNINSSVKVCSIDMPNYLYDSVPGNSAVITTQQNSEADQLKFEALNETRNIYRAEEKLRGNGNFSSGDCRPKSKIANGQLKEIENEVFNHSSILKTEDLENVVNGDGNKEVFTEQDTVSAAEDDECMALSESATVTDGETQDVDMHDAEWTVTEETKRTRRLKKSVRTIPCLRINLKKKCIKTEIIRKREQKKIRQLIKKKGDYYRNRVEYNRAKMLLKKAVIKVGKDLKQKGEINDNMVIHSNSAVFFEKLHDGKEERCLICGEIFQKMHHEEAEHHLFTKHLNEYETLHKYLFNFEHYLDERDKRVKCSESADINFDAKLDQDIEDEDEYDINENDDLKYITKPDGEKRIRKTKEHMLYTCLLCNNSKYVSVQYMLHFKNTHPEVTFPDSRKKNYIVGVSLHKLIKEKKIAIDIKTATFSCTVCDMKLETRRCAVRHAKYGHSKGCYWKPFVCNLCKISFKNENLQLQHMVEAHQSMRKMWFGCGGCLERFETKSELRQHEAEVHGDAFQCPFTGCQVQHYQTVKGFKLHCIRKHLSNLLLIDEKTKLKEPSALSENSAFVKGNNHILNTFVKEDLPENINNSKVDDDELKLCSFCGETFCVSGSKRGAKTMLKIKLARHIEAKHQDHIGEVDNVNIFKCSSCDMKFLSFASRNEHEKDSHWDATCPYKDCGKTFKRRNTLNSHLRRNHAKITFCQCQFCGKELCDQVHLRNHIKAIHEKTKDYDCPFPDCGKSFSRKSNLSIHVRIHTGEKPLKCEYCDFRGRQRNNITAHMKAHHADKIPAKVKLK